MASSHESRRSEEGPNWDLLDIREDQHRLFLLLWRQLLDDATPDTWQVRSTNVLSLLGEIESVAHIALTEHMPSVAALPRLVEEVKANVRRDHVISEEFPWFQGVLAQLETQTQQLGEGNRAHIEAVSRTARVARERVARTYRANLESHLLKALDDSQAKERVLDLTVSFASLLVLEGASLSHLRAVGRECLENAARKFSERVGDLLTLCSAKPEKHSVHFATKEWEPGVLLSRDECWVKSPNDAAKDLPPGERTTEFLAALAPNDRVVRLGAIAIDPYAARVAAEAQLTRDFAAIAFNTHRDPSAQGHALVLSPHGVVLVPADASRRNALRRSGDWEDRTRHLLSLGEVLNQEDHRQLSAALQYYRLAITHPSDEVRLVNLWVASETIVRGLSGSSIIGKITEFIPPLLATRNIRRVGKSLAHMLSRSVRWRDLRSVGVMTKKDKNVNPRLMIEALKDDIRGRALLGYLGHDPLLRFRLFRFAEKTLKDAKSAADYIEANRRNIEWQLERISRARNAIVHRADAPSNARQLLQHLQSYVWTAIREISEELRLADGTWSLSDALEHFHALHAHALNVLRSSATLPVEALLDPRLFLKLRSTR